MERPLDGIAGVLDGILGLFEGVQTTRESVAVSVGILLVAGVIVGVVLPRLVQFLANRAHERVEEGDVSDPIEAAAEHVDASLLVRTTARLLQVATVAVAGFVLLLVWGHADLASTSVDAAVEGLPLLLRTGGTLVLLLIAYLGSGVVESWVERYARQTDRMSQHEEGIVFRVLQIVMLIAVSIAALSLWNVELGGLLVGAGFLGIVVGMAARRTLGSLIAGFVLMLSRPFEIGDWVRVGDSEGVVTDVTIVNTRLRNVDGETVVIPNDNVNNSTVINRTNRNRLRLRTEVGIDYETDIETAESVIEDALDDVERILTVPTPQVIPTRFGDSAVTLEVRYWIDKPSARRRWQANAAVIRAIKAAFDDAGIEIPFPQRTLSGRDQGSPPTVVADDREDGVDERAN